MKRFLSKYSYKLPLSLAYMLQASEYIISEYLEWYSHVKDFNKVESRKKLVLTKKSILIIISAWAIIISSWVLAIILYRNLENESAKILFPVSLILAVPHFTGYILLIPLFLIKVLIQNPVEKYLVKQAQKKISKHKGIKIAIAGSFGKTSLKEILKTILSKKFKVEAPKHSHNTLLGVSRFIESLDNDEDILIFELGEYYPNDIKNLCTLINPNMGIITGVNYAHFQKFKDIKTTIRTIFELSDWLNGKNVYINGDNKIALENAPSGSIKYSNEGCANIKISKAEIELSGTKFNISDGKKEISTKTRLLGIHQLGPIALSGKIAFDMGMTIEEIASAIKSLEPFEHRLKPTINESGIIILDDSYNGNPDGVNAIINFIKNIKGHRRFYLTPGLVEMGNNSPQIHRDIGKKLALAKIEKVLLIKNSVTPYIEEGLRKESYKGEVIFYENMPDALSAIPHIALRGDVVVLQNDWPDQYR